MSKPKVFHNIKPEQEYRPSGEIDESIILRLFEMVQYGDISRLMGYVAENGITLNVINRNGESLLHAVLLASQIENSDKYKMIEYLVTNGVKVNIYDKNQMSPLDLAVKQQQEKIVSLLLSKGANVRSKNKHMMSPLHHALNGNKLKCKFLPKIGSMKESTDNVREVPEIKNMTLLLIDILNSNHFKNHMDHISKTILNYDEI